MIFVGSFFIIISGNVGNLLLGNRINENIWKSFSNIIEIIGVLSVFIGGIGFYIYQDKIENNYQREIQQLITEKNNATEEIANLTAEQLKFTKFFSELDNQVNSLLFEVNLNKGLNADEFQEFIIIAEFMTLGVYYEIQSGIFHDNNGNSYPSSTVKCYPIKEKIDKPWTSVDFVPIKIFDTITYNIGVLNRTDSKHIKLRDFHEQSISIMIRKKYLEYIDRIKLIANDWIIFECNDSLSKWDEAFGELSDKSGIQDLVSFIRVGQNGIRYQVQNIDLTTKIPDKNK